MVKRQLSSGNLLPKRPQPFDHGVTAMFLVFFGVYSIAVGGTMTGLSYAYEKRPGFTSVAESYNIRCDIAGPILLALGGVGILLALFLITVFGVCSTPEWSREVSHTITNSHGNEVIAEENNTTAHTRFIA